jgi:hypothetical protein
MNSRWSFVLAILLLGSMTVVVSNVGVLAYATSEEDEDNNEDVDNADLTEKQEELLNGVYEWIESYGYKYPVTFREEANREMMATMLVCASLPDALLSSPVMQETSQCDSMVPKYKALCEQYNNVFDECKQSDIDGYLEKRDLQIPSEVSLLEILPPPQLRERNN